MKVKEESEKVGLKLNIQKTMIMASSPITSWEIDGEIVETVSDFIFLGSKITAECYCSHEIKRRLLLRRKVMTNLDSIFGGGNGTPLQYFYLENPIDRGAWWAGVHGVAKSQTRLSNFTFTFHFRALEKEMATHSSILAWRIPGTGKPGGLPSMGSHRVGHDWSDLAAAADSILKRRDITLPTKVCLVKAMVFPVVKYGCESWTIKKAELQIIDAFELWC